MTVRLAVQGVCAFVMVFAAAIQAETLSLDQALQRAYVADPRIGEKAHLVTAAQGLLDEAQANKGWRTELNSFLGFTTAVDGGFYDNGTNSCTGGTDCVVRDDLYDFNNLSLWLNAQFAVIKPLHTFGKIENYSKAAKNNILIKQAEVELQRQTTRYDVSRAYYGFLTARDIRYLMDDSVKRLSGALDLVTEWLEQENGQATEADKFALTAGVALLTRYQSEAASLEKIALGGLKVLTGIGLENELKLADSRITPEPLPASSLQNYKAQALKERPEMKQVEAGLSARRALVAANKSDARPNLYAGIGGTLAYSPGRERVDNPYIYDPFNHVAATPVIGLQWSFSGGIRDAKVKQAQAELDALISKASFAQKGIPYQVEDTFTRVHAGYEQVEQMKQASINARRWMIAAYTDFEAGLKEAEKIITAFQAYVLAHSDYLRLVNDYNMNTVLLKNLTAEPTLQNTRVEQAVIMNKETE
ncbi:MAG: TolC family protein [Gammaproteobacteria bacterium]|nr:TolC family protein [Gammaproteobacteria bacterium]